MVVGVIFRSTDRGGDIIVMLSSGRLATPSIEEEFIWKIAHHRDMMRSLIRLR